MQDLNLKSSAFFSARTKVDLPPVAEKSQNNDSIFFPIIPLVLLDFTLQPQQQSEWCWAAVTSSVAQFYKDSLPPPNSALASYEQCALATYRANQMQNPPPNLQCCPSSDQPQTDCNLPWKLNLALKLTNNYSQSSFTGQLDASGIIGQLENGAPIGVLIDWNNNSSVGHYVVISGIWSDLGDYLVSINDPHTGNWLYTLSDFANSYRGKGTWVKTSCTQAAPTRQ